jgi:hypothetical protein
MPFFAAVGHIDDTLSPEDIKREYHRRFALVRYHQKRAAFIESLGGACSRCGVGGGEMALVKTADAPRGFHPGQLVNMSEKRRKKYVRYVVLLCAEHKMVEIFRKGKLTHGTYWAAYKKKCQCDDCGEYRLNRALERREERRERRAALSSTPSPW